LIAAVIIGQLNIPVTGPLKPFFFLMFLFAIGYAVGPQFVRGISSDGLPQAIYAALVCVFCLIGAYIAAKFAGYDMGSAAGLYAGSQTISASMGLATDAINRLGLSPEETKNLLDAMPVAAVTYIFGTVGSDRHRAVRPGPPRHRSRGRMQALRREAWGQEAGRRTRHRLASIRVARVSGQGRRTGCGQIGA
jgi:uncharacterized transporter YbjL